MLQMDNEYSSQHHSTTNSHQYRTNDSYNPRGKRTVFLDEGVMRSNQGEDYTNKKYDNTRMRSQDSVNMERASMEIGQMSRDLEDREFEKFKRDLKKSQNDFYQSRVRSQIFNFWDDYVNDLEVCVVGYIELL